MKIFRCIDWADETDQRLSVKCDGSTGNWVPASGEEDPNEDPYADVLGTQPAALLEHQCQKDTRTPLIVPIAKMDPGAQLSCETPATTDGPPATTYTIMPPNKCVLLCDFHLAKVIEGRLSDVGEFKFYVANTDDEISEANVNDMIKCWP